MWLIFALISSLLIGISVVFSKAGMKDSDALVVNAITNTCITTILIISAIFSGGLYDIPKIRLYSMLLIFASAIAISFSWIFFYLGLEEGSVNVNMAIDKSAIPMTMILSAIVINEQIKAQMIVGTVIIGIGTIMMTETEEGLGSNGSTGVKRLWILYAFLAAVFASIANIIIKLDATPLNTNLTSALRYIIVTLFLWSIVLITGRYKNVSRMDRERLVYIFASGAITGVSYIFFYKALFWGSASVVTVIFKMGFIISTLLSYIMLGERLLLRGKVGVALLVIGINLFLFHK